MSEKKFKVYVTRLLPGPALDVLRETCDVEVYPNDEAIPYEELLEKVKNRDGIITLLTDKIDAQVIKAGASGNPPLKIIANYAVGYDNIDVACATEHSIYVSNTPGVLTNTTADIAWALMLAIARRIPEAERFTRAGKFKGWSPTLFLGGDVYGKTLGIVGVGRIGAAVALRSKGFNMRVLYHDVRPNPEIEREVNAQKVDMDTLLKESDFISIHVPLMPETRHLFGKRSFEMMKPTAYLINTSRGPVIDEEELAEALKNKVIAGAALDVFEYEPKIVPALLELENVIVVPHIASASVETRSKMAMMAVENVIAALNGKTPPTAVNRI
ncbi:TPA: D-glycerate dehydrogenase [Candidatus Poribacteria bacterium]|nr:D-glycerate dehydrogenase [Candidatus Poribacteria bacterium]